MFSFNFFFFFHDFNCSMFNDALASTGVLISLACSGCQGWAGEGPSALTSAI